MGIFTNLSRLGTQQAAKKLQKSIEQKELEIYQLENESIINFFRVESTISSFHFKNIYTSIPSDDKERHLFYSMVMLIVKDSSLREEIQSDSIFLVGGTTTFEKACSCFIAGRDAIYYGTNITRPIKVAIKDIDKFAVHKKCIFLFTKDKKDYFPVNLGKMSIAEMSQFVELANNLYIK